MVAYTEPQQPNNGRKKKGKGYEEREIRSLLILYLEEGTFLDSGKEEEGKTFYELHVLGMNDDLWDGVRGLDCHVRNTALPWRSTRTAKALSTLGLCFQSLAIKSV